MFVSYALNFEDALLWRALPGVDNGLYIDIRALELDVRGQGRAV